MESSWGGEGTETPNTKRVRKAGPAHENEQYDWSGTDHPVLRQYMKRLTEPGEREVAKVKVKETETQNEKNTQRQT